MPSTPINNKCRELGCKNLKTTRSAFCIDHGGAKTEKDKENSKLYATTYWKKQRIAQLSKEPLCAACLLEGRVVPAVAIDHIFPHRQDANKFKNNLFQSLCTPHHTLKTQAVVAKKTKQVICTAFANGKRHDFRLFKESKTKIHPDIKVITDTGYQGIQKLHSKSVLPKKKTKKNPLTKEEKQKNQELASERVVNENVIGVLKRFKIISDKYRNTGEKDLASDSI